MKLSKNRVLSYIIGLFIMTVGVSISVKSNLGVSPVSSIPYTATLTTGLEMGLATIVFHAFLVLIQLLILRKEFRLKNLLQILAGIIFGWFTTFSNFLMSLIPDTDNLVIRSAMLIVSIVLIAVGIFFYVPADIIPLAGEGVMGTISDKTKIAFPKVKIAFDITMVVVSAAVCLIFKGELGSVGAGTIAAAVLVGVVLGIVQKMFGGWQKRFLAVAE